jgi:hypothetical protein
MAIAKDDPDPSARIGGTEITNRSSAIAATFRTLFKDIFENFMF